MANLTVVLTYRDVFGKSSEVDLRDLLKGVSPEKLLLILGKTNAYLLQGISSHQIFQSYTSSFTNHFFRSEILKIDFRLKSNPNNVLFNEKVNFNFLKFVVENFDFLDQNKLADDSEILEINFFRSYLIFNQLIYVSTAENFLKEIPAEHYLEFAQILMIKKTINDQEVTDFFSDIVKIKAHLHYFFLNEKALLEQFYKLNGIENPDLWIFEIFRILTLADNYENITFYVEGDHWIADYCDGILINNIIGKSNASEVDLKLNSLYKKDGKYYVMNWSHFGQHLFHRITYQLYELYKNKNNVTLKFDTYKSMIAEEVSEKIVFRKAIEKSFGRRGTFISYDTTFFSGFPDCYLRYNNFIFIFEFKDNALSKEFIQDDSYENTKSFIDERFIMKIKNGKNKPKGISQLRNVIKSLNENLHKVDPNLTKKYKKSSIEIYSVIVVSETLFSLPAVESYLTKEFKKIKAVETEFRKINDLSVINISYLIHYFLNAEKPDFYSILKSYILKKKTYREKGVVPDFPTIEKITYPEVAKAKQLVEIANELPICDMDLDEQLRRVRESK